MRVCLMIEGQEGVTWDQWVALARACEENGVEGLFRSDHYVSVFGDWSRGSLDAWATLAGLAAITERIRLGTLVSPATFRHPSALAKEALTVDHISGGRVELGLGAGWHEPEHRAYGFAFPSARERLDLLEEQIEVVHRQWHGLPFTFEGRHYRIEGSHSGPPPVQQPHPPLILGGHGGRRSIALAARWADEYNTLGVLPDEAREIRGALGEAWEREGRDAAALRLSMMTGVVVGTDRREVVRRAEGVMETTGDRGDPEEFLREVADTWIVGTVDQAADRLAAYEDAGVDRVMLQHLVPDDLATVELLARLGS